MNIKKPYTLFLLLLAVSFLNSCEQTFDPVRENDNLLFSISGYLDVGESEQVIRVINLHQQNLRDEGEFQGTVYLHDVMNGVKVEMEPELHEYSHLRSAYNFTVDYPIEIDGSYEIIAEQENGAMSRVRLTMPTDFRDPVYQPGSFDLPPGVRIWDVDRLAEVSLRFQVLYPESGTRQNREVVLTNRVFDVGNTRFVYVNEDIIINALSDQDGIGGIEILNCEIFVAKAGPEWINFENLSDNEITIPDGISNVDNGTGYVVGVFSKRIHYPNQSCTDQEE